MLTVVVSIFVFCCGFTSTIPKGVTVNGIDLGGLSYSLAVNKLRENEIDRIKSVSWHIYAGQNTYMYTFPEINFCDNFADELKNIKQSGEYFLNVNYYLNGLGEIVDYIAKDVEREVVEPYVVFNKEGQPFTYYEGNDGAKLNTNKLINDINYSLNNNFCDVTAEIKNIKRVATMPKLLKQTALLYRFTTYFDGENASRAHNIKLAASLINGTIINVGDTLSFNKIVGERTKENGFTTAKIIEEGKFVEGVGGGVCQVSTTLYNAALLSGLDIVEYHPHSLKVAYVPLSRDAMVSGSYCDLKIKNNKLTPIYVRMNVGDGYVTCSIYGFDDGWKYSYLSVVCDGDESENSEVKSEGYLISEKDGVVKKKFVRRDKYGLAEKKESGLLPQ